ncbi:MAG: RNA-directed DNA polymerase [Verrucomicrobiales bacterium]
MSIKRPSKDAVSTVESGEDILKDFMARGYFPAELPFCFSTGDLARVAPKIAAGNTFLEKTPTVPTTLSVPGRGLSRRSLSIPNPISQFRLTMEIEDSWQEIERHCLRSEVSFSRLRRPGAERALWNLRRGDPSRGGYDETTWLTKELAQKRLELGATSSHVLYADIVSFYDSIYTHSIPWALHGKRKAKKDRFNDELLGNRLDRALQNCNHGQTKGIPVGPDTSRVISEIIAVSCDLELQKNLKKRKSSGLEGIRWIDDYHLYFQSASGRDKALGILIESLEEFELSLNHGKTRSVLAGEEFVEAEWVRSLRRYPFRSRPLSQFYDILGFCDLVATNAKKHPMDSVALYASKILWSLRIASKEENITTVVAALWRLTHLDPRVVPVACRHSDELSKVTERYPRLQKLIAGIIDFHLGQFVEKRWALETCWMLWLCVRIGHKLTAAQVERLEGFDHTLVALMTMEIEKRSLTRRKLDYEEWKSSVKEKDELLGARWLLAYELRCRGKVRGQMGHPFFDLLKKHRISFMKF